MKKCEVIVDRVSLVVCKGSIVEVEDRQFEIARKFLKPIDEKKTIEKPIEAEKPLLVEEEANEELPIIEKKTKKKK